MKSSSSIRFGFGSSPISSTHLEPTAASETLCSSTQADGTNNIRYQRPGKHVAINLMTGTIQKLEGVRGVVKSESVVKVLPEAEIIGHEKNCIIR